jgi:hypothetical protein
MELKINAYKIIIEEITVLGAYPIKRNVGYIYIIL